MAQVPPEPAPCKPGARAQSSLVLGLTWMLAKSSDYGWPASWSAGCLFLRLTVLWQEWPSVCSDGKGTPPWTACPNNAAACSEGCTGGKFIPATLAHQRHTHNYLSEESTLALQVSRVRITFAHTYTQEIPVEDLYAPDAEPETSATVAGGHR